MRAPEGTQPEPPREVEPPVMPSALHREVIEAEVAARVEQPEPPAYDLGGSDEEVSS